MPSRKSCPPDSKRRQTVLTSTRVQTSLVLPKKTLASAARGTVFVAAAAQAGQVGQQFVPVQPWAGPDSRLSGGRVRAIYQRAREIRAKTGASESGSDVSSKSSPVSRAKALMRTVHKATHAVQQTDFLTSALWAVAKERRMRNEVEQQALIMLSTGDVSVFDAMVRDALAEADASEDKPAKPDRPESSMEKWLRELRMISKRAGRLVGLRKCAKQTSELVRAIPSAVTSKSDIAETLDNCNHLMHEASSLDAEMTRLYGEMREGFVEVGFGKKPTCPFLHVMRWQHLKENSVTTCNACCVSFLVQPEEEASKSHIWACEDVAHDPYYLCASCGELRMSQSDLLRENWRPPIQDQWQEELQQAKATIEVIANTMSPKVKNRMNWGTAIKTVKCIVRMADKDLVYQAEQAGSSDESSEDSEEELQEELESGNIEASMAQPPSRQRMCQVVLRTVYTRVSRTRRQAICLAARRAMYTGVSAKYMLGRASSSSLSMNAASGRRKSHVLSRSSLARAQGDYEVGAEISRALIRRKYVAVVKRIQNAVKLALPLESSEAEQGARLLPVVEEGDEIDPNDSPPEGQTASGRGSPEPSTALEIDVGPSSTGSSRVSSARSMADEPLPFLRGRGLAIPKVDAEARVETARRWALSLGCAENQELVMPPLPPLRPPVEYRPSTANMLPALPLPAPQPNREVWRLAPSGAVQLGLTERWRSPRSLEQDPEEVARVARQSAARFRATPRELILPSRSSIGRSSESSFPGVSSKPASDPMAGSLFSRCVNLDDTSERHGIYEAALRRSARGR